MVAIIGLRLSMKDLTLYYNEAFARSINRILREDVGSVKSQFFQLCFQFDADWIQFQRTKPYSAILLVMLM